MTSADVIAVDDLTETTFAELIARLHLPERPRRAAGQRPPWRLHHLVEHDSDGAVVAVDPDRDAIVGAAMALRRGSLWGLSLLVIDPRHQGKGLGRRLLGRALEYA